MAEGGWARSRGSRAQVDGLRRGAWYPVMEDSAKSWVVVEVNGVEVRVERERLQLRREAPTAWSVVKPTPEEAESRGPSAGVVREPHFVCPGCHTRYHLVEGLAELLCLECGKTYSVDWTDLG